MAIFDLEMPEMNGIDTTLNIRAHEKQTNGKRLFILGLTGHEEKEVIKACMDSGMDVVLPKPIVKMTLLQLLQKWS